MRCAINSKDSNLHSKPDFMCFKDLDKAFDRIQLKNVVYFIYMKQIPPNSFEKTVNTS